MGFRLAASSWLRTAGVSGQDSPNEIAPYHPHPGLVFAVIFAFIFLLHATLLRLPYFWDEAGYYVPAARDILLTGSLIPHTTVSNAHPPLVLCWLALWWKLAGYDPLVTRSAMLVVSAFSLLGVFRLAERVAELQVAVASTLCTALYPVFFAQSSMAHVDLAVCRVYDLGIVRLPGGSCFFACLLVLVGRAGQGNGDPRACGTLHLGDSSVAFFCSGSRRRTRMLPQKQPVRERESGDDELHCPQPDCWLGY